MRGFSSRGIGPRDTSENTSNDVLGGNRYVAARLEAEFPLGLPSEYGMLGSFFVDAGSLWSLDDRMGGKCIGSDGMSVSSCELVDDSFDLRSAAGFGLLWDTPIGPLRMDFSRPLDKNELDETNTFDITISTRF